MEPPRRSDHVVNPQAHGRVAKQDIILGVVAFNPQGGELGRSRLGDGAAADQVQDSQRRRGVTVAEIPGRQPNRVAPQNTSEHVPEGQEAVSETGRANRVGPRPLDVTDDRKHTAAGMCEQPLWQGSDKRHLGDRQRIARTVGQKMVDGRRTGAVTREEERDEAVDLHIVFNVGSGQAVRGRRRRTEPWPILAEEGACWAAWSSWPFGQASPCEAVKRNAGLAAWLAALTHSTKFVRVAPSPLKVRAGTRELQQSA